MLPWIEPAFAVKLRSGNVLIACPADDRLIVHPDEAAKLHSGNVLIAGRLDNVPGLAEIAPDGRIIWERLVENDVSEVRPAWGYSGLVGFGFDPSPLLLDLNGVPNRTRQLADPNPRVRLRAVQALARHGPKAAPAIGPLLKLFEDASLRPQVERALIEIGSAVVPSVSPLLRDPRPDVRGRAAEILGHCGDQARDRVPAIVALLKDDDDSVRRYAFGALRRLGSHAKSALPLLCDLLRDDRLETARRAAWTIEGIASTETDLIAPLMKAAERGDPGLRSASLSALGSLGPQGKELVPALRRMLRQKEGDSVYQAILGTLGKMGPAATAATPEVVRMVGHEEDEVRSSAVRALGNIGPPPEVAVPLLLSLLNDKNEDELHLDAIVALGTIGPAAKEAVSALAEAQRRDDRVIQEAATRALERINRRP